ncbi:olfactory receptor 6C1-like [Lithobates pipiens]
MGRPCFKDNIVVSGVSNITFVKILTVYLQYMFQIKNKAKEMMNQTSWNYFIIQGISDVPEHQIVTFIFILLTYLLALGGNLLILLLVYMNPHLHIPMYIFLCNLAILDVSCSTVTQHNLFAMFVTGDKKISFYSCMSQIYFFSSLTATELFLLTVMSYDRYIAICHPLHYVTVMNSESCSALFLVSWLMGFIAIVPYIVLLLRISCYKCNVINHFFCDMKPVMELSCSDTFGLEVLIFTEGIFLLSLTPFVLTFISYVFIIVTIMRIPTNSGRRKAFYTCSSHLMVVTLLYGTLFCQYLRPASTDNIKSNKVFSLFNTAIVPVLNPMIYSLKNEDVKLAIKGIMTCFKTSVIKNE